MKLKGSRAEQWLQKYAYEHPDAVLHWGPQAARQAALVSVFFEPGWIWRDGEPCRAGELRSTPKLRAVKSSGSKSSWIDPLARNGEDTLEGFLQNNMAAKSFMAALVQTLAMARRPQKEAEEIVRRAAEKMYPDYVKRLKSLSSMAFDGVQIVDKLENLAVEKPKDGCLLCSIPEDLDNSWREIATEALLMPKKISEKFGKDTRKEVVEARRWTDKMLRSHKKRILMVLV